MSRISVRDLPPWKKEVVKRLKDLHQLYPLPVSINDLELSFQHKSNPDTELFHVGLRFQAKNKSTVQAGAGGFENPPVDRAYFELIERWALNRARSRSQNLFRLYSVDGENTGRISGDRLFPENNTSDNWHPCHGNGLSARQNVEQAVEHATFELIERDRILRSWFGGENPRQIDPGTTSFLASNEHFPNQEGVRAFRFPEGSAHGADEVKVVIFLGGFPSEQGRIPIYGFGASNRIDEALRHAKREFVQIYLPYTQINEEIEPYDGTVQVPADHLKFFRTRRGREILVNWLEQGHPAINLSAEPVEPDELQFADITPECLSEELLVLKTVPQDQTIQLGFGREPPVRQTVPEFMRIHPVG